MGCCDHMHEARDRQATRRVMSGGEGHFWLANCIVAAASLIQERHECDAGDGVAGFHGTYGKRRCARLHGG